MTGYLVRYDGQREWLPELMEWSIKLTDGEPCDSFCVRFACTAGWRQTLEDAVRFVAEEQGTVVFTGVVDDHEIRLDRKGLCAEVTGRGLAALLMDNQVRAAEYLSAQSGDILKTYVYPYGIGAVRAEAMGPVERFVVETGYTCWQVLAGFCRHSADIRPRFEADGTLVLEKRTQGKTVRLREGQCISVYRTGRRYGVSSEQILVNTRTGAQSSAVNEEFAARGGRCVKVHGRSGNKIRATWRTAQQRLEDDRREAETVEVRVSGSFFAQPLDRVELRLEALGLDGDYTVRAAESGCDTAGEYCVLTLGDV